MRNSSIVVSYDKRLKIIFPIKARRCLLRLGFGQKLSDLNAKAPTLGEFYLGHSTTWIFDADLFEEPLRVLKIGEGSHLES